MKRSGWLFCFLCTAFVVALLFAATTYGKALPVTAAPRPDAATFLILGLDDAAENTDTVLLVRYDPAADRVVIAQIPRDTYCKSRFDIPKLNHIYPACRAAGDDPQTALRYTKEVLSEAFGIPIDGAAALPLSAFRAIVDAIGGVPFTLTAPLTYTDQTGNAVTLPEGDVLLDGYAAAAFVRYRAGYADGDLGRVRAQGEFLAALYRRVASGLPLPSVLSLLFHPAEGLTVAADREAVIRLASDFAVRRRATEATFFSFAGDATETDGTWYYVINRRAAEEALSRYFATDRFDPIGHLTDAREPIRSLYEAEGRENHFFTYGKTQISRKGEP